MKHKISELILEHVKRRPEAKAQDIFKFIFQGVFGVGHIMSDRAWEVLIEEVDRIKLDENPMDPLFESVSPDGSIVRVNLRQYIDIVGDLEGLFEVMKKSAEYKGDPAIFIDYWNQFKELVRNYKLSVQLEDIQILDEMIQKEGIKPRHHTESYRDAYYPAYRVVNKQTYQELIVHGGMRKNDQSNY